MNRCHQCGGKFGLVRHHYLRHPFCSRRCIELFKEPVISEILRYKKALFGQKSISEPKELLKRPPQGQRTTN
jgi:hypothetical protein